VTKARGLQGRRPRERPGSHITCSRDYKKCEGMNLTFTSGLPCWELEFQWTPKFSERNYKGQNSLFRRFHYIIGKLLKHRCLKLACIAHLDIWNKSYGQKKGWESNWQFDSWSLKVENRPDFLACRQRVTYHWKALNKGYNFALDLIAIRGMVPESWEFQLWEFQDSHLGVSRPKTIWMWPLWKVTKYTIRGKVVASPKSEPWWVLCVLVSCGLS
jgi:hypothetical protein